MSEKTTRRQRLRLAEQTMKELTAMVARAEYERDTYRELCREKLAVYQRLLEEEQAEVERLRVQYHRLMAWEGFRAEGRDTMRGAGEGI